jgi:hypothetical protein
MDDVPVTRGGPASRSSNREGSDAVLSMRISSIKPRENALPRCKATRPLTLKPLVRIDRTFGMSLYPNDFLVCLSDLLENLNDLLGYLNDFLGPIGGHHPLFPKVPPAGGRLCEPWSAS